MNNYNIKKIFSSIGGLLSFSIKRELHSYFNPIFFISYTNNIKNYLINQIKLSKMITRMKKDIHNIVFFYWMKKMEIMSVQIILLKIIKQKLD